MLISNILIKSLISILLLVPIKNDCCKMDLSPFEFGDEVFLGQDKKVIMDSFQIPLSPFFTEGNYEIYEFEEIITIFGLEKTTKKGFAFIDNKLSYIDVEFPVEINQFLEIIESLKSHKGYEFTKTDNKYSFYYKSEECGIILNIISNENGHGFLFRIYNN